MKNLIVTIIMILSVSFTANAQKTKKTEKIQIQTTAQCDMCKERLEKAFAYEKGVKSSQLEVETAVFTVEYLPAKTTPEQLKEAVTKIGYDADELPANKKAYDNLPMCCQKGGHPKE